MKIIDILKSSAVLLGLAETSDLLNDPNTTDEIKLQNEQVKQLFDLAGFSIRELCTNYASVLQTQEIETISKKYPVNKLENYIRVRQITNDGQPVKFKVLNRSIVVEQDGNYLVEYESYPTLLGLDDDVSFLQQLSMDVAVYGLCSYFCVAKGMFEDFEFFHDEYIQKADALKDMKSFTMPQRRWE